MHVSNKRKDSATQCAGDHQNFTNSKKLWYDNSVLSPQKLLCDSQTIKKGLFQIHDVKEISGRMRSIEAALRLCVWVQHSPTQRHLGESW